MAQTTNGQLDHCIGDSGTITILVQVAQNIGNTSFDMGQGVTGTGFVNVHNDIRTDPVILRNKATMFVNENSNPVVVLHSPMSTSARPAPMSACVSTAAATTPARM